MVTLSCLPQHAKRKRIEECLAQSEEGRQRLERADRQKRVYAELAQADLDWSRVDVFPSDDVWAQPGEEPPAAVEGSPTATTSAETR